MKKGWHATHMVGPLGAYEICAISVYGNQAPYTDQHLLTNVLECFEVILYRATLAAGVSFVKLGSMK